MFKFTAASPGLAWSDQVMTLIGCALNTFSPAGWLAAWPPCAGAGLLV